jgi:hypothetical protein
MDWLLVWPWGTLLRKEFSHREREKKKDVSKERIKMFVMLV